MKFIEKNLQKEKELLFIKSSFLNGSPSHSNIEYYLNKTKEIINRELPYINTGGFLVIQTQDIRIDGYLEPLAKRFVDMLTFDNLWLKEIIIVNQKKLNSNINKLKEYLNITHEYLLVYEKRGSEDG